MTPELRAQRITDADGPRIEQLVRAAVALLNDKRSDYQTKADRIIDVCDALSRTIVPHTPCAGGCSGCCYMATAISGFEARMIGRYIGRAPRELGRENIASPALEDDLRARYTGVRCTFLVDGRCSIYPVRPASCRLHHSLNDDASNCTIVPGVTPAPLVPHLNLTAVTVAVAFIFRADDFGDIREFFPPDVAP